MPHSTFRPDLMGRADLEPADPVTCGEWTSATLVYTAGHFGIDDSGSIKVSFRSATDQTRFQLDQPQAAGFVTVATSNGAGVKAWFESNRNIRPWHHTLYVQCNRFLAEGDTITIRFGDRSRGGPGFRAQTFVEPTFEFRVHVDAFATYDYVPLPDDRQPSVALVAGPAAVYRAVLPTLRAAGDTFALGLKAEDRWGNPTARETQRLHLRPSHPVAGLPQTAALTAGDGVLQIDGLRMNGPGTLSVRLEDEAGTVLGVSNPLVVQRDPPFRHFWSDMHGQSEETVGTNSARDYFTFARDKGMVDIAGHQGNDFQITDTFWRELNELTAEFDSPGRFLAVPGYEWSGNTSVGGDHNVWYRTEGQPIFRSHRALVGADADPAGDCLDARALFDCLHGLDALVVAHVGGRYADVKYAHDARLEPSVEVHSAWGTFEWIVRDALAAGYRIGIVGGSDDHKGRPGASYPGASKFGAYGGLTCHLLPELTRDALFAAFRARRHYATTGCRAHVALHIDGFGTGRRVTAGAGEAVVRAEIGDILSVPAASATVHLRVIGHAGIERIELRDGLETITVVRPMMAERQAGRRLRVQCEGAEYKGRGRLVRWDVRLGLTGCRVVSATPINFWNPDLLPRVEPHTVAWSNVTTGGRHAVDLRLSNRDQGTLTFNSSVTDFRLALAELGEAERVIDCGGLGKAVRLVRLPDGELPSEVEYRIRLDFVAGVERRIYARIDFEDGHSAWTSPVYITHEA